jgi:lipopolysaccharide transport system ATP-binding protein
MYVRLAFGVAAHLEPEILIVDEVLAVGDAEFQKKALGKMKDVSAKGGRTVLFVSHNLTAIQTLCSFAILMENGKVDKIGESKSVIDSYLSNSFINSIDRSWNSDAAPGNTHVKLISAKIIPQLNSNTDIITINTALLFQFEFILYANEMEISIAIEIYTLEGIHIFTSGPTRAIKIKQGKYVTSCLLPAPFLNSGTYTTAIQIVKDNIEMIHRESDLLMFEINDTLRSSGYTGKWPGLLRPSLEWKMYSANI